MRHWLLLCFALTGCPATDDQVVNTLTNMGFSEVDLLSCTDKTTLQQKDAQIAELQMVKNMAKRGVFAYGSMLKVNCWVRTDGRVTYSPRLQPARSLQEIMRAAADLV